MSDNPTDIIQVILSDFRKLLSEPQNTLFDCFVRLSNTNYDIMCLMGGDSFKANITVLSETAEMLVSKFINDICRAFQESLHLRKISYHNSY